MKKKLLTRALGVFLSAAMILGSLQVGVLPAQASELNEEDTAITEVSVTDTETKESDDLKENSEVDPKVESDKVSENTTDEDLPENESTEDITLEFLTHMEWKTMCDKDLENILDKADFCDIGIFLSTLNETDLQELKDRKFMAEKKVKEYVYIPDVQQDDTYIQQTEKEYDFLEYCTEQYKQDEINRKAEFKNTKGSFLVTLYRDIDGGDRYTWTQANITLKNTSYAAAQIITVAMSGNESALQLGNLKLSKSDGGNYLILKTSYTYTHYGFLGYRLVSILTPAVIDNETNIRDYGHDGSTDNVTGAISINIATDAGVGSTAANSETHKQEFRFKVCQNAYTVAYNGNGCTSGNVEQQTIAWSDETQVIKSNGYTKTFRVNYNGNGGTPDITSNNANYTFAGWGINNPSQVTTAPGTPINRWSNVNGSVITMYAIWNPGSVIVPNAKRTGYIFCGWANVGAAGTAFVPTADTTLVAVWNPITYRIDFDSKGGTPIQSIAAKYDQEIVLPTPTRPGYTFAGWAGISGNKVKNLASTNGAVVQLTANWTANTNTAYTINRYVQIERGNTDPVTGFKLYEAPEGKENPLPGTEVKYAITDQTITVPAGVIDNEIYVTPEDQVVQVKGDGSTVVNFYYLYQKEPNVVNPNPGSSSGTTNNNYYTNNYGMSEEQAKEILKAIENGSSFKIKIGDCEYTIVKNEDGSLSIKIASIDPSVTVVEIPSVVQIGDQVFPITEIYKECFKDNQNIQQVIVGNNITKIGDSAFENCTNLSEVILNEGLINIGNYAFKNCTSLKSIIMPSTLQTIGKYAFAGCTALKVISLNEGLLKIGSKAFYNCCVVEKIKIPKTLIKMDGYVFEKCSSMKSLTFATEANLVTIGAGVFKDCKSIKKVKLPQNITTVPSKTFYNCSKLESITMKSNKITTIGNQTFKNCSKLKSVSMGNGITSIGEEAFMSCKQLKRITLTSKVMRVRKKAFYNCRKLKSVYIKSKSITSFDKDSFKKCAKGIQFKVPDSKIKDYSKLLSGKY